MTGPVDMPALIAWGLSLTPPACAHGIARARLGWMYLTDEDRYWLAEHCGAELLAVLARDHYWEVRWAVADRCGEDLLDVLAQDPNQAVRMAVTQRRLELAQ